MQIVSRFEAALLRLLQYFLRGEPIERANPLIEAQMPAPKELSEGAIRLIKDALAKRCTFLLAQRGGWRDERFLRQEKPKGGRLWQRTAPVDLGLTFSQATLQFLVWITACRPGDKSARWSPEHDGLTHGDLLLLFFAHEGLRETSETLGAPELRKRAPFNEHALCWLAYPEDFTRTPTEAQPRFQPWMSGVGSCILEALQPDLHQRWVQLESSKERIEKPDTMRLLGNAQDRVLDAFLGACEKANRRDLARFLLRAAHQLLGPNAHAGMWTGSLQMSGQRLADRAATYQAATSLLRHVDHLAEWANWARSQGRFDDDYAAAQLYLTDWEQYEGDLLHQRAQTIGRHLDPMKSSVTA
jgi:hypothetical protein